MQHQLIKEFLIYDTEERKFYPIDNAMSMQIGDYSLEIEYKKSDYKIDINYATQLSQQIFSNKACINAA